MKMPRCSHGQPKDKAYWQALLIYRVFEYYEMIQLIKKSTNPPHWMIDRQTEMEKNIHRIQKNLLTNS